MGEPTRKTSERAQLDLALTPIGPFHRAGAGVHGRGIGLARACVVLAMSTWVPLLIAASAEGLALDHPGGFLRDFGLHVRLLFSLPLLLVAERAVDQRLRSSLRYIEDAGLVAPDTRAHAREIVQQSRAIRGSMLAHVAIVLVVAALSVPLAALAPPVPTWAHPEATVRSLGPYSLAGWIDLLWSAALYRLIIVRWFFRLGLWVHLLMRLARLPLRTNALHQDGIGGLGPLADAHEAFAWVLLAISSTLAARLAFNIQLTGDNANSYALEIAAYCALAPLPFLAPMMAFAAPLERDRRRTLHELAAAAGEHAQKMTHEYLRGAQRRPLALGEHDIVISADLDPTFDRVYAAWAIPFRRQHYAWLFAAAAVPMLGVFLASVPVAEILERLLPLLLG